MKRALPGSRGCVGHRKSRERQRRVRQLLGGYGWHIWPGKWYVRCCYCMLRNHDYSHGCVHCGLCLSSCPTYRETGLEMFSPRGRIYLMRSVSEGRFGMESEVFQQQMDACLNCRACEAVCPSGVQYGAILEASRTQIEQAGNRVSGRHKI